MLTGETLLHGWQHVLGETRAFNRAPGRQYDLRPYWRGKAYERYAGSPETIVRAQAFASVLNHAPLHVYDGEMIAGSKAGFVCDELPPEIDAADYAAAVALDKARGQRDFWAGFDHTLADYPSLLARGIGGIFEDARQSQGRHQQPKEQPFLESVVITLEALAGLARRYAAHCRQQNRCDLAEVLEAIAWEPPRTLHQAMQLVWLTHIAFVSEGRGHNALGRIDQYLLGYYREDIRAGRMAQDTVLGLLCHLWAKIEELGEVTNICIGGITSDGNDGTNELSYLCLKATELVQTPHSNLSARFHDGTPEAFHRACFECIRTGVGFPAIFNDHVLIPGLEEIRIPRAVARDYCMVGCIETMLAGRQPAWSDSRFNAPLYLLRAMQRLREMPARSYPRLMELFQLEIRTAMEAHVKDVNAHIARFPADRFPDPFLSGLTRDCIDRARDVNDGGAELARFHGVGVMGLATIADSLAAVKRLVFESPKIGYDELMSALANDYEGNEAVRQLLSNGAPKYGNDKAEVDEIAAWFVGFVAVECLRHTVVGGGRVVAAMAANVQNISAGKEVGATPDGRHAGRPLSDAASPHFGCDRNGPTAFLRSVSRPDYHRVLTGSVINMKFEPAFFQGAEGAARFSSLTHFFVAERIPELQFNFTGDQVLRDAQANPAEYGNLVVRVSGFSAYYTRLGRDVQDDILRRRAHGAL